MTRHVEPPIGRLIRRHRLRRAMTQTALADALAAASGNRSVSRDQVSRWESGGRVPGPYWRGWLGAVLDLPRQELDRAAAEARAARLLTIAGVPTGRSY
ncbi:helix-turn-helix protein [Krasilnikovia cinnamomea]|uniref:Helix-turn-helix protein n=1 Tax=Krasilnikovia cinnamomea TaxID=349313 RepID=A0A4Q7ZS32_9ACTN|nr:helix-turn-helix domain-containing protein [Krasilnikovia cinnamomea]RZU53977.1 helix-turn-helix protein [Krasilnikovia cinnamomea]